MAGPRITTTRSKLHKAVADKPTPKKTEPKKKTPRDEKRFKRMASVRDKQVPPRPNGTVVTLVVTETGEWSGSMIVPEVAYLVTDPSTGKQSTKQKRFEATAGGQFKCVEILNQKWVATLPAQPGGGDR